FPGAGANAAPAGPLPTTASLQPPTRLRSACAAASAVLLIAVAGAAQSQSFDSSGLSAGVANPTSLQFGPDQRLYVGEQDGDVKVYTVQRDGPGQYSVAATELIDQVKLDTPNHDDDGGPCTASC